MKVIKRDGTTVDFDRSKIIRAIQKANEAVDPEERISEEQISAIAHFVQERNRPACWWRIFRIWWSAS